MARSLSLLSYNVHAGVGMDGRYDLQRVADLVDRTGADVVCLQEVDRHRRSATEYDDQPALLADGLGMHSAYGVTLESTPTDESGGNPRQYGILTLSRYPISEAAPHQLTRLPDTEQRTVLETRLDVDGTSFTVFNTHLGLTTELRRQQVDDLLAVTSDHDDPHAVVGDFNAEPDSDPVTAMRTQYADALERSEAAQPTFPTPYVRDGSDEQVEVGDGNHVNVYLPRERIDYVFVDGLDVGYGEVRESIASDHSAVLATVRIP